MVCLRIDLSLGAPPGVALSALCSFELGVVVVGAVAEGVSALAGAAAAGTDGPTPTPKESKYSD